MRAAFVTLAGASLLGACQAFLSFGNGERPAEAGVSDAAVTSDVGADVSADASSDVSFDATTGASWCATQGTHALCLDFEDPNATLDLTMQGGQLTFDSDGGTSRSMRVAIARNDAGSNNDRAYLTEKLNAPTTTIRCAFDFLVDRAPASPETLAWMDVDGTYDYVALQTNAVQGWSTAPEAAPPTNAYYQHQHLLGKWERVAIEVRLSGPTARVSFPDDKVDLGAGVAIDTSPLIASGITLNLGVRYPIPTDTFVFRYDNVICDLD